MTNEKQKEMREMPDFNDEEFWKELNQKLWLLVNEAEPSKFAGNQPPDFFDGFTEEAIKTVSIKDSRKKECLPFARCEEVADAPGTLTTDEKAHLLDCQYCERRIAAYSESETSQAVGVSTEIADSRAGKARNVIFDWFEQITAAFNISPAIKLSFAALVLLVGTIVFFVLRYSPDSPNLADVRPPTLEQDATNEGINNVSPPDSTNPTFAATNTDKSQPDATSNPDKPKTVQSKTNEPARERVKQVKDFSSPLDLTGIVGDKLREFIIAAWSSGEVGESDDMASLFVKLPTMRSTGGALKLISPNRRAMVEDQPTFRWKSNQKEAASYQVSILDERKKEILPRGEKLTGNTWVYPNKLSPGIYYWEVTVFDKAGKIIEKTQMEAIFKIVDKAEVERVKSANRSHLVKAIYFINAGLLDDAKIELEAELKDFPNSQKARNILRQVKKWQKQLR